MQIILLTEKQKREKLKQFLLSRFPRIPVYLGYDLEMRQLCRIKQESLIGDRQ